MTKSKVLNMGYKATQSDPNNLSDLISHNFLLLVLNSWQTDLLLLHQIGCVPTLGSLYMCCCSSYWNFILNPFANLIHFYPSHSISKLNSSHYSWPTHKNTLESMLYTSADHVLFLSNVSTRYFSCMCAIVCWMSICLM